MTSAVDLAVEVKAIGSMSSPVDRYRLPRALFCVLVACLCLTPFCLVIVISLGEKIEGAAWRWSFDFSNYLRFFVGADWPDTTTTLYLKRLWFSFYYAIIASILAVATAFPFAYLMSRQSRRAQTIWLVFLLSSVSLSEVFVVMGWDILLSNRSGLPMVFKETGLTEWLKHTGWFDVLRDWGLANPRNVRFKPTDFATILTMSYLVWPYAVVLLYPALARIDNSMLEAARTMGAGSFMVLRTVVLPTVRLPVLGTTLLLFVFLLGSYVAITVFAHPSRHTLAVSVYDSVRGATMNAPFGAAQSIILLVTALLVLMLVWIIGKHTEAGQ
jgi:putative spermidine/putrescine transport system permease protein